ncbi:MAG: glycosyltransferase [Verrucomicrobiota bacterium]|nr:glycosyltransferase [Verrucomicrobiota bacterium]
MNRTPRVSVIIIFWNVETFLEEAIASVLAQPYSDWELLLVDDGSTDHSTAIATKYAAERPGQIRYLEHPNHQNRGMSATRNLGLHHARGEYVTFLDADDVWVGDALTNQVAILDGRKEATMVYGATQWWYSWTGDPLDKQRDFVQELGVPADTLLRPPQLLMSVLENQSTNPAGILWRRSFIEHIGGYEEQFTGLFEDQAFHAKALIEATVFVSAESWYRYRKHPASWCATAVGNNEFHPQRFEFLKWLDRYFREHRVNHPSLRAQVNRQLRRYLHPTLYSLGNRSSGRLRRVFRPIIRLAGKCFRRLAGASVTRKVRFGNLRRLQPISRHWGSDRGLPIDRYYIEHFLALHAASIQGHVMEIADDTYTRKFGRGVVKSDVLHGAAGNPQATLVADLTKGDNLSSDVFDCIICTQTLPFIYDFHAALKTLYRILKPGGVLLVTFAGISKVSREDLERWGDYWRFTCCSAQRVFEELVPKEHLSVTGYGNVLTAVSFLHGLAASELRPAELYYCDPEYEVIIGVSLRKPIVARHHVDE